MVKDRHWNREYVRSFPATRQFGDHVAIVVSVGAAKRLRDLVCRHCDPKEADGNGELWAMVRVLPPFPK